MKKKTVCTKQNLTTTTIADLVTLRKKKNRKTIPGRRNNMSCHTDSPPSYQEATTSKRGQMSQSASSCVVISCPFTTQSPSTSVNRIEDKMMNPQYPHSRTGSKSVSTNRPLVPFGRTGRRRDVRPIQPDLNHGLTTDPSNRTRQRQRVVCRHGCGCFDLLLSFFGP